MRCEVCDRPLERVTYVDDLTGEPVERLRCPRCFITYIPKEKKPV